MKRISVAAFMLGAAGCGGPNVDGSITSADEQLTFSAPVASQIVALPQYFDDIYVQGQREITTHDDAVFISYPGIQSAPTSTPNIFVSRYDATNGWNHSPPLLPSIGDVDGPHEDTAVRVDGDGRIHVWGGMHHHPMRYRRSLTSHPDSTWSALNLPSEAQGTYTYPESAVCPLTGDVYHISRADTRWADLFHYRRASGNWHKVATVFSGDRSDGQEDGVDYTVYLPELVVDSNGDVHIVTLWARGGPKIQRHQGTYVRYDPTARRFYKANGVDVSGALPITTLDVDDVWQWQPRVLEWSEIEIGTDPRIAVDTANRPVIGFNYTPVNGTPTANPQMQHRVVAWTGTHWQRTTLDALAGLYSTVNVQASGGVARAYVTLSSGRVFAYQSHDDGALWDPGSPLWLGRVQSTFNRDPSSDVVLDRDSVYEVSYPPRASPRRITLPPSADSYVRAGAYANQNYGLDAGMLVKRYGSTNSNTRMTYLKFDLRGQGINGIRRAQLKIHAAALYNTPIYVSALRVAGDAWTESSITWNNRPYAYWEQSRTYVTASNRTYTLDVTDYVSGALGHDGVVSIALWSPYSHINTGVMFYSREHSRSPVLEIDEAGFQEMRIAPIDDAFVRSGAYANANYDGLYDLILKRDTAADGLGSDCSTAPTVTSNYSRIAYLKFDVRSVPANASRAVLRLYKNAAATTALDVTAFLVEDDTWRDHSITWNTAPPCSLGAGIDAIRNSGSSAQYVELDLTPYVRTERDADGFVSIGLYRTGPSSSGSIEFDSNDAPYGRGPRLVVTF